MMFRSAVLLAVAFAAVSVSAETLSVSIQSPASIANDPVVVVVIVEATPIVLPPAGGDGQSVTVTMGGLSTSLVKGLVSRPFKPPCCWPAWVGSLDVSSLPDGQYEIVATALNSTGEAFSAARTVTLDRRAVIAVQQPNWSAATWLQVPVSATCTDSVGCTSFSASRNFGPPALTGTNTLAGTIDVSPFDGYGLQSFLTLNFLATDAIGQASGRSLPIYPEGSPHVRALALVPGKILDADATRFLYQDEAGRIHIQDRASGASTLIHPAADVSYASLTQAGALLGIRGTAEYLAKSWENGTLVDLGNQSFTGTANGRYVAWTRSVSGVHKLFWRDVVAGVTREIAPVILSGLASPSLSATGAIAYWQGASPPHELRLYDPQAVPDTTVIVSSSSCGGSLPRTDGTTVVFRSYCMDGVYAWKGGVTRTLAPIPLTQDASYDVAGGWIGLRVGATASRFDPQGNPAVTLAYPEGTLAYPEGPFAGAIRMGPDGTLVVEDDSRAKYVALPAENLIRRAASPAGRTLFIGATLHFALGDTFFIHDLALPKISTRSQRFGAGSMGMRSLPRSVTLTNDASSAVTVQSVTASAGFVQSNDCATLTPGQTCTVQVQFAPPVSAGALGFGESVLGSLSIASTGATAPIRIALAGDALKTFVPHFYSWILGRDADGAGFQYWQAEASRMVSLGADLNEAWYAMTLSFFNSAENTATARTNAAFMTNLYNTFLSRAPDPGGLAYWTTQLDAGLPREVALASFMFSPEFAQLSRAIFGGGPARAEIDMVMDFYRGLLGRLPDSGGFNYWVQQFRTAQCQGEAAVRTQVEAISGAFANSPEYGARQRSNPLHVADLYNSFLRRGGDLAGVRFWIDQLNAGMSREQVRRQFMASPEFANRVQAVIAQSCAA